MTILVSRVSYGRGGGLPVPPSPPEILKFSMGICHENIIVGNFASNYIRSNLKGLKN